jgi:hypothetical protein
VDWDIMFVASLSGQGGVAPTSEDAEQPLRRMLAAIGEGRVDAMAAFDRNGDALRFVDTNTDAS